MFTIDLIFLGEPPPKDSYSSMTIDQVYGCLSWEADLTIVYDNQILFSEEVAIVEFYWYLVNWYRKYLAGNRKAFAYFSIESTEPVLFFSPQEELHWTIDSIWKKCSKPAVVKEKLLCSEVRKLLEKIIATIEI